MRTLWTSLDQGGAGATGGRSGRILRLPFVCRRAPAGCLRRRVWACHSSAAGLLLDAFVEGYGGGGKVFDWSLIPVDLGRPLILSGGLDPDNVGEAVRRVRPWAVDVSSGVESGKGIKDAALIAAFIAGVRHADG